MFLQDGQKGQHKCTETRLSSKADAELKCPYLFCSDSITFAGHKDARDSLGEFLVELIITTISISPLPTKCEL